MLDPKILSDEEIRLCYNEWSKRYRKNNPEKSREAIKKYWEKRILKEAAEAEKKEVMENGKEQ